MKLWSLMWGEWNIQLQSPPSPGIHLNDFTVTVSATFQHYVKHRREANIKWIFMLASMPN